MDEFRLELEPSPQKGKYRTQKRRKRSRHYFHGRRPSQLLQSCETISTSDNEEDEEESDMQETTSVSAKKLRLPMPSLSTDISDDSADSYSSASAEMTSYSDSEEDLNDGISEDTLEGYRIVHLPTLIEGVQSSAVCSKCHEKLVVLQNVTEGIATPLHIKCNACSASTTIDLPSTSGSRTKELNLRSALSTRFIGRNYAGLRKFLSVLGVPVSLSKASYYKYSQKLHDVAVEEAMASMQVAAMELHRIDAEDPSLPPADDIGIKNVTVTCDGTWAKRGFTSLHGVVVIISLTTGQVIDYKCLSKSCEGCKSWKSRKGTDEYKKWVEKHTDVCKINFEGSSGAMECEGALRMFRRSILQYKLRYTSIISDGDSKTHTAIVQEDVYDGVEVQKLECVGHVQKRMGTGLRKVKKEKKLGGKGKLTDALIDSMQTYYGMAIRNNKGNIEEMERATLAILYHKLSTDDKPQHQYCPHDSWCKYNNHKGTEPFQRKKALPESIGQAILPLFKRLSEKKLLEKCTGGFTQNQNEAFNNLIWSFCPKAGYAGAATIETSVALAVCIFNNGYTAIERILSRLGVSSEGALRKFVKLLDDERVKRGERKGSVASKSNRKKKRLERKKIEDKKKDKEGETYVSGGF